MQVDQAVGADLSQVDVRILLQVGNVRRGGEVDEIDVTGEQGRDTRGAVGDRLDDDLVPRRGFTPVVGVRLVGDVVAGDPFHELVRAGADHGLARVVVLGGGAFASLLRNDAEAAHVVDHQRERAVGLQVDGMVVDDFDALDHLRVERERRRAVRDVTGTAESEFNVGSRERASVMPFDALAQIELPGVGSQLLPRFRQSGNLVLDFVLQHQFVEHGCGQHVVGAEVVVVRVHGVRLGCHADSQVGGIGRTHQRHRGNGGEDA